MQCIGLETLKINTKKNILVLRLSYHYHFRLFQKFVVETLVCIFYKLRNKITRNNLVPLVIPSPPIDVHRTQYPREIHIKDGRLMYIHKISEAAIHSIDYGYDRPCAVWVIDLAGS